MTNPFHNKKFQERSREGKKFENLPRAWYDCMLLKIKECELKEAVWKDDGSGSGKRVPSGEFEMVPGIRFVFVPDGHPDGRLFASFPVAKTTRSKLYKFVESLFLDPLVVPLETSRDGRFKYVKDLDAFWAKMQEAIGAKFRVLWAKKENTKNFFHISKIIPALMTVEEKELQAAIQIPEEKNGKDFSEYKTLSDFDEDEIPF